MFWEKISKEVQELGQEMMTFYEDVDISESKGYNKKVTHFYFRKTEIFEQCNNTKTFFCGFCNINNKEQNYLHDCASKAWYKKITFKNNKTE